MSIRRIPVVAVVVALVVALALAAPVAAGSWAEITPDAATTEPPRESEPVEIGFTVLQHGVTPASWVTPTVRLTDLSTGETSDLRAVQSGAEGHFTVQLKGLTSGFWTWSVSFPELGFDPNQTLITVHERDGSAPTFTAGDAVTAIGLARMEIRDEIYQSILPQLDTMQATLSQQRAINDRLTSQVDAITEERDALAARLAETEGDHAGPPATIAGILLLAVLAGAAAAFVMNWLGGRSAPREIEPREPGLSPAPRGSTPV